MNQNAAAEADAGEQIPIQKSKRKVSVCQVGYTFLVVSSPKALKQGEGGHLHFARIGTLAPNDDLVEGGIVPNIP